jgi:hypothetical protein
MSQTEHRFQFTPEVDLPEAEATLRLSLLAAEGLYGEARIRTDVSYSVEPLRSEIRVEGDAPVSDAVAQIYTSLLSHEFGRRAFTVRRRPAAEPAASAA